MSVTMTLARRETTGLFYSPIAYVVMAIFLLFLGFFFGLLEFVPGQPAGMRQVFTLSRYALIFVVPLMTMGLLADEFKSGRIEMLRTSPITEVQIVLGKFGGAMMFYLALLACTLIYVALLVIYGRPDFGPLVSSYLGMLLMGGMFIAIGLFYSSVTQNQIVAAMASMVTLLFLGIICGQVAPLLPDLPLIGEGGRAALRWLAVETHMEDFAKGVIGTAHVVYFLGINALFLFLTYVVLESRKWR
jgi:ABC-2 type transport system permease protein